MYENLVTTLMRQKETLQLEDIISALLGFNLRKKVSTENSHSEGLVKKSNQEHGRNKSRSESRNNKAQSKSKKRKDIKYKKDPSKSANIVEEDLESDADICFLFHIV